MENKKQLPESLKREMKMWRNGFCCLPKEYIDLHEQWAEEALTELTVKHGLTIHNTFMKSDGWMDGMRVLHVIAERKNKLFKMHWHDGSQVFFVSHESGGSSPLSLNLKELGIQA